jgi:hypothetical protein
MWNVSITREADPLLQFDKHFVMVSGKRRGLQK